MSGSSFLTVEVLEPILVFFIHIYSCKMCFLVQKEDDDDQITLEEAAKLLQGKGIINHEDIHYLPEDERVTLKREVNEQPLTETEQKNKIKEMTVKDASNIQTYYKTSRLGIKEVENKMTKEELAQERE